MTGDGVNDLLALRQADCSIAMAQGSDAARQISQVVLLDSDFSALPSVLSEGRRVVNNIHPCGWRVFCKNHLFGAVVPCMPCSEHSISIYADPNHPYRPHH